MNQHWRQGLLGLLIAACFVVIATQAALAIDYVQANKGPIDILLVGDSITQQWGSPLDKGVFNDAWNKHFAKYKTINIGIGGDEVNSAGAAAPARRPNVVFILADDLGAHDLACFGSTYYETPHLDRLASRGVRLTNAYAASPLCSPTRSSILTGQHPARIGITAPVCHLPQLQLEKRLQPAGANSPVLIADAITRLHTDYFTLAEALKEAGYATAHFGKWHLGHNLPGRPGDKYEPKDQGFDVDFPHTPKAPGPGGGYLAPWKFITDAAIKDEAGRHIDERMADEAGRFIRANKDQPFYLNFWLFSVHSPWNARKDYIEHFKSKADPKNPQHNPLYAAMVKSLDDAIGRLLQQIDDAGVADNTVIVFWSDNGGYAYPPRQTDPEGYADIPATSNLPLRSGKASIYEGGTREPGIVVWPGKVQAGATSDILIQSTDFYPTVLAMCGLRPRDGLQLDGFDQTSALQGGPAARTRVFCHFPHGSVAQASSIDGFYPATYVRQRDHKLIRFYARNEDGADSLELYDLSTDPGERNNLAAEKPELVRELNALITDFLKDTEAVVPIRNPSYEPRAANKPKAKEKAAANATADPLQGWKARRCDVTVKEGIVTVTGTGPEPFLGVGAGTQGPAVLRFRARCAQRGDGKIEWLNIGGDTKGEKPQSRPFTLTGGDWQDVSVNIPATGPLGIVRLYVPAQRQPVEIDWIELKGAGAAKNWKF